MKVIGKVGLADLAGSERQAKTHTSGQKLKEGGSINKSLSALEKVINDIHNNQRQRQSSTHVNYRDSKLTRILQPFLSGKGHSLFILCVSPCASNAQETCNTMKFGQRLQGIRQFITQEAPAFQNDDDDDENGDVYEDESGAQSSDDCDAKFGLSVSGGGLPLPPEHMQKEEPGFAKLFVQEFAWSLLGIILLNFVHSCIHPLIHSNIYQHSS